MGVDDEGATGKASAEDKKVQGAVVRARELAGGQEQSPLSYDEAEYLTDDDIDGETVRLRAKLERGDYSGTVETIDNIMESVVKLSAYLESTQKELGSSIPSGELTPASEPDEALTLTEIMYEAELLSNNIHGDMVRLRLDGEQAAAEINEIKKQVSEFLKYLGAARVHCAKLQGISADIEK